MAIPANDIRQEADDLMVEIGSLGTMLDNLEGMAEANMKKIRDEFSPQLEDLKKKISSREKALMSLAKRHKQKLFEDRDRIDLEHGALLFSEEKKVKRIKGFLARLEVWGQGQEAIKTIKSVDWDVVEKWAESDLAELGTARVKKEVYAYELVQAGGKGQVAGEGEKYEKK